MNNFVCCLIILAYLYCFYRLFKSVCSTHSEDTNPEQEETDLYFEQLIASVHTLEQLTHDLENIENIITNIEMCDTEHLTNVQINVPSVVGGNSRKYGLLLDGSDFNSRQLLLIAYEERSKLRSTLLDEIENIYRDGVTKAVTKAMDSEPGEGIDND